METSQVVSELNPFQAWPLGQCMDQSLMWSFTWYGVKTKPSRTSGNQASGRVGGRATPKTWKWVYFGTIPFTVARRAFGVFWYCFSATIHFLIQWPWKCTVFEYSIQKPRSHVSLMFSHKISCFSLVVKAGPSGTDHRQKSSPWIALQVTRPQTLEDTVNVYTYKYVYKSLDDLDTVILFELNDCILSFLSFFCCLFVVVCLGCFKKHSL